MNDSHLSDTTTADARSLRWHFAGRMLDERSLALTVNGQPVRLEPKPLDLLMFLLRHPGEVVTKNELQEQIWPERVLSESVLTKCVAKLRQGLGDDAQEVIKTVHGYGYRLAAPVTVELIGSTLPTPQLELQRGDSPPLRPHWQLQEYLGGGGYGEVWLAEHSKTHERRVFKFGLDVHGLAALKREITLFRLMQDTYGERRDLVRLLDWNLDEAPYFIETEYVAGGALPEWAARQGGLDAVPLTQRLELMAQAADALAAAHAAGVLHKDLKPSNLLVAENETGQPGIKLGDFGSGRIMDLARLESLAITRLGFTQTQVLAEEAAGGTPRYLAPELFSGQMPTIRSDIYALGVMLYQVVVGDLQRPLGAGWEQDIADVLLCEDIAIAAASQASRRLGDAAELAHRLRNLAARHAERATQLAAAEQAECLRRELAHTRQRRTWATALAGVLALALIGTGVLLWHLNAAVQMGMRQGNVIRAINLVMMEDLFATADPFNTGAHDATVRDFFSAAVENSERRFPDQPYERAIHKMAVGHGMQGVGDYVVAEREMLAGLKIAIGKETEARAFADQLRLALSLLYADMDRLDESATMANEVLSQRPGVDRADPASTAMAQFRLAQIANRQGHHEQARQQLLALRPIYEKLFGPHDSEVADLLLTLADASIRSRQFAAAEPLQREALHLQTAVHTASNPKTIEARRSLALAWLDAGEQRKALDQLQSTHKIASEALGPDHGRTLRLQSDIASALAASGAYAQAIPLMQAVVAQMRRHFGPEHTQTRLQIARLASLQQQRGTLRPAQR